MKKIISVLKYLFLFSIGITLFWLAFRHMDVEKMKESILHINLFYIGICFIITILSHLLRGIRWNMLIRPLGYDVSVKHSFVAVMMGYFANLALPRMGEVSRCVVLNRTDKIPVDKLIGTVITERLIDFISLMLLVLLNLVLEFKKLKGFFVSTFQYLQGKASHDGGIFTARNALWVFLIIVAVGVIAYVTHRKFRNSGVYGKITEVLKGFLVGMKSVLQMRQKGMFLLYTFLIWLMYYLMVYICFFALDITSNLGPNAALTVLVIGSFGFVAPVQGGIGAYHIAVMSALALYGVTPDKGGYTFALVAHTFQTAVIIVVGALSFVYLTVAHRKKPEEEAVVVVDDEA